MAISPTDAAAPQLFDRLPMSPLQVRIVALTVLISALDGYDVLSVTFAAPAITHQWGIGKAAMGLVLSSGLIGMAAGSLLLAPLADAIGRRWMTLISLAMMGLGSLLCAFAGSMAELTAFRIVTGLGVGTAVAVIGPLAAEFSNARRRPLAMALMAMGYPAGGLVGGLLGALLLRSLGWPSIFVAGFAASAVLLPLLAWTLPESPAYLIARRRAHALERLNAVLERCRVAPLAALPDRAETPPRRGYAAVFTRGQRGSAIRLALVNSLNAAAAYYLLSWMPQMVSDAGYSPADASLVAAVANLAGLGGGILLGALARHEGLPRISAVTLTGMGLATIAFGWTPPALPLLLIAGGACGFFLFATVAGLFATFALAFPDESRASGNGLVMGIGRITSAVAPLLAGWLFATGLGRFEVSLVFGACAVVAGLMLATMRMPRYG